MKPYFSEVNDFFIWFKNELTTPKGYPHFCHYHDAYEILLVFNASNYIVIKDLKYPMQKMQLIIIPPYVNHSIFYD